MNVLARYEVDELKLIYKVLHTQLLQHVELMDAQLVQDLQSHLQALSKADGVDVSDHGQWSAWLARSSHGPSLTLV